MNIIYPEKWNKLTHVWVVIRTCYYNNSSEVISYGVFSSLELAKSVLKHPSTKKCKFKTMETEDKLYYSDTGTPDYNELLVFQKQQIDKEI